MPQEKSSDLASDIPVLKDEEVKLIKAVDFETYVQRKQPYLSSQGLLVTTG